MRSLKTFLRNKKNRCCEWNKCVLVWMWRDFQSYPEFCNCGDWGSTPPVPPVPVITYSLSKVEDTKLINYTSTKLEDWVWTESYRLHLVYDDNDDLESASITNW